MAGHLSVNVKEMFFNNSFIAQGFFVSFCKCICLETIENYFTVCNLYTVVTVISFSL